MTLETAYANYVYLPCVMLALSALVPGLVALALQSAPRSRRVRRRARLR